MCGVRECECFNRGVKHSENKKNDPMILGIRLSEYKFRELVNLNRGYDFSSIENQIIVDELVSRYESRIKDE